MFLIVFFKIRRKEQTERRPYATSKHEPEANLGADHMQELRKDLPVATPERPQLRLQTLRDVPCPHGFTRSTCPDCIDWTERPTGRQPYHPKANTR
jgi:hypothetical protein